MFTTPNPEKMEPRYSFPLPIQVRFNDVDIMGHVSNTVYQNYYDAGKTLYFDSILPDLDYKTIGVVGANVRMDYLKPIFMRDEIFVESRISVLGHKSFTMEHRLLKAGTFELLSTCSMVVVCYDVPNKRSQAIPQHWRDSIIKHEGNQIIIKQ
jgi:acyl-CoA thioester hydrolase